MAQKDIHEKPNASGQHTGADPVFLSRKPLSGSNALSISSRFGHWLEKHPRSVSLVQWLFVVFYLSLLVIPSTFGSPESGLCSRLVLWGIGWPLIVLSMLLAGRFWCGLFCPDGTLTEFASRHGKKRSIPRWIRWKGWPCTVLLFSTLYGQLTGFYGHFSATLLLLGIPTCLAILTGYLYGNGKRVWCMYLCPGNGFFALLAKLSFLHFSVDTERWQHYRGAVKRINCAPLINIRQMKSTSDCHSCGRCIGYRDSVELATRRPSAEVLSIGKNREEPGNILLLVWAVAGICTMALAWSQSSLYGWFMQKAMPSALLGNIHLPWWLTESPEALLRLLFIVLAGSSTSLLLYLILLATQWASDNAISWKRLAYCLLPVLLWGIFLGMCRTASVIWAEYGISLAALSPLGYAIRMMAALFSISLAARIILPQRKDKGLLPLVLFCVPVLAINLLWLI